MFYVPVPLGGDGIPWWDVPPDLPTGFPYLMSSELRRPEPGRAWAVLMLALALWGLNHAYVGMFEHDARVYSLLVWHWLSPEAYARDPFFLFGSQDRYSVFTPVYGSLAALVGLSHAALTVSALGGMLWVAAAAVVARGLLGDSRWQTFAILCCAMASFNYSPNGNTFVLNEVFPTARSIAFPLGALALGVAMRRHYGWGVALAAASCALHPLLGIWPLLMIIAHRMSDRIVVVAGAVALAAMTGLHFGGVAALQRLDPTWESIIRHSSIDIFVGPLGTARINETLAWLSLLLWAAHFSVENMRRWYRLGAAIGASGFLVAQLAAYLYPVVLIVQAQLWRAMWVAVFLGVFALAQILDTAWRSRHRIWWAIGGLLLVIASDWLGYILFAGWILFQSSWRATVAAIGRCIDERVRRFAWLLLAGLLVSVLPGYVQDLAILGNGVARDVQSGFPVLDGLLLAGGLGVGALLWTWLLMSGLPVRILLAGSAVLLAFSVLHWDQRRETYAEWERQGESSRPRLFAGMIRPGDVVLWPGPMPQRVWHELGTANYGSSDQVIGGVFSREKTFEMLRRRQRLAVASLADSWPLSATEASLLLDRYRRLTGEKLDETGNLHESYKKPIWLTGHGMLYACEDPALDWVVSDRALSQNTLPPVSGTGQSGLWLYSCGDLRTLGAVSRAPTFIQSQHMHYLEKGASR